MPSTAIPAVKAAILKILQDAEDLEGITVTDDYKVAERADEHVWVWKSETRDRNFRGLGHPSSRPPRIDEEILVTLRVVAIGGKTAPAAEARVFQIVEAVETILRGNIKLEGTAIKSIIDKIAEEPLNFDNKIGHGVLLTVLAETRI